MLDGFLIVEGEHLVEKSPEPVRALRRDGVGGFGFGGRGGGRKVPRARKGIETFL